MCACVFVFCPKKKFFFVFGVGSYTNMNQSEKKAFCQGGGECNNTISVKQLQRFDKSLSTSKADKSLFSLQQQQQRPPLEQQKQQPRAKLGIQKVQKLLDDTRKQRQLVDAMINFMLNYKEESFSKKQKKQQEQFLTSFASCRLVNSGSNQSDTHILSMFVTNQKFNQYFLELMLLSRSTMCVATEKRMQKKCKQLKQHLVKKDKQHLKIHWAYEVLRRIVTPTLLDKFVTKVIENEPAPPKHVSVDALCEALGPVPDTTELCGGTARAVEQAFILASSCFQEEAEEAAYVPIGLGVRVKCLLPKKGIVDAATLKPTTARLVTDFSHNQRRAGAESKEEEEVDGKLIWKDDNEISGVFLGCHNDYHTKDKNLVHLAPGLMFVALGQNPDTQEYEFLVTAAK